MNIFLPTFFDCFVSYLSNWRVLYVLFVWSGCYMSCLYGLPFFLPTSFIASVLCTCISMVHSKGGINGQCIKLVTLQMYSTIIL